MMDSNFKDRPKMAFFTANWERSDVELYAAMVAHQVVVLRVASENNNREDVEKSIHNIGLGLNSLLDIFLGCDRNYADLGDLACEFNDLLEKWKKTNETH